MKLDVVTGGYGAQETDCLVIGVCEERSEHGDVFTAVDNALDGYLSEGFASGQFSVKKKDVAIIHTFGKVAAKRIMLVGMGKQDNVDFASVRDIAGRIVTEAVKAKCNRILVSIQDAVADKMNALQLGHAIAEGAVLSSYKFDGYQRDKEDSKALDQLSVAVKDADQADLLVGIQTGAAFAKGTNLARDFVNMPANYLTPSVFAKGAVEVAERYGMGVEVLERADMERLGMGAILGVAQGSANPPKMVIIKYQGRDTWDNVMAYVGKGITFDTGGISLKPAAGMESMVMDMGGAAAVIGAMDTIGRIKPKVNILAVVPMVENMPDGAAYRPGDVLTSMSGRTIEIISTDAEGRLILADAITYAKELGASRIVDLATLTGAVLVALGTHTTGAMSNDKEWVSTVLQAASDASELMWELPTFDVYREQYKSRIADLKNTGGRFAGTITAGMFLGEFAEDTPWVHLDIAGTAWQEKGTDTNPIGASGVMVRTLARLALDQQ